MLIGGSNSTRLHQAFTDMGINTVAMDNGGWAISRTSVESVLPKLAQHLAELSTRQCRWFYTALIIQVFKGLSYEIDFKNVDKF